MTEQKEIQLYNDIYRYLKAASTVQMLTKNDKRAIRRRVEHAVLCYEKACSILRKMGQTQQQSGGS